MYRLFLALRYLWSRPISWISMVGIWLSVMALVATLAIMTGFLRQTRQMIKDTTSDLILNPGPAETDPDAGSGAEEAPLASFEAVKQALEKVDGVAALSPHLLRPAMIRVGAFSADMLGNRRYAEMNFVQVVGIDLEQERGATDLEQYLDNPPVAGVPPDDPDRPFEIDRRHIDARYRNADLPRALVGERLFEMYSLHKGGVITLVTLPRRVGADEVKPLSQRFHVAGTVRTNNMIYDRSVIFVPIDRAREFAESPGEVTEICLKAEPDVDLVALRERVSERLEEAGLEVQVQTWMDRNENFLQAVENERGILGFLLFFFVGVACFNVFATLTIMVSDKTRDIGVLNSMGSSARGILELFVGCGLIMAISSALLGCLSGVLIALNINQIDNGLESLFGVRIFQRDIFTFSEIPVEIEPLFVTAVFVVTLFFAFICDLLPALRAARMDPVAALRHE